MGTPDFAVPSLKSLIQSNHEIILVVTGQDKPRGRGQKILPTPVKKIAELNEIPIYQPAKLRSHDVISELEKYVADLYVVVAFRILPEELIAVPKKGVINLHASLLPKYRGAAPIQWALLNGDQETGVTTFFIEKNVDTGDIILQESIKIIPDDNAGTLHNRLSEVGANVVSKTVDLIAEGNPSRKKQIGEITKAPKITKEMCQINWEQPAGKIVNQIRAFSPFPGAYTYLDQKLVKIYKAKSINHGQPVQSGKIWIEKGKMFCSTEDGWLQIYELQIEGKKKLSTEEFLRGYPIKENSFFG